MKVSPFLLRLTVLQVDELDPRLIEDVLEVSQGDRLVWPDDRSGARPRQSNNDIVFLQPVLFTQPRHALRVSLDVGSPCVRHDVAD